MTYSTSPKFRAIGGASVLALSIGLTGTAFAQTAPAPLMAAPTPTAPVAPANAEECAVIDGTLTCAPGTDADGFFDLSDDPLGIDVQDGSVVQGPIVITGAVTGAVDGSVQTGNDFDGGLLFGAGSDVTIGGFIQTTGQFSVGVEVGENSQLTNDGTIYTSGDNFSDAVSLQAGSTFTNTGLVQTDGAESFGIFGGGDDISVVNSVTGTIVTSGLGSFGIAVLDGADIQNDGLIQTFGDFAIGIDTQESGTVTNSGNIVTSGANSFGVGMRNDASFTNTATGLVSTSGDEARGVSLLLRGTVLNDGVIETSGEGAGGVYALANANVTNNGSITTTGDNFSDAVTVRDNGVVTNNGTIQVDGADSVGVFGFGNNVSVTNAATGEITANGFASYGVLALDGATVQNDGSVETTGDLGIGIDLQNDGTIVNNGSVITSGELAFGIGARDNTSFTNGADGVVSTTGADARAVTVLNGATIINNGTVETTGSRANAIRALVDSDLTNNGSITTTGDDGADAVEIRTNSVVTNTGIIQTDGENSIGVFGRGEEITLTNEGSIAAFGSGSRAVFITGAAEVNNSGSIEADFGAALELNGLSTVTNSAAGRIISNGGNAVRFGADGSSLINSGTIASTAGGAGVAFANGTITNAAGASISGDLAGISSSGTGTASVVNSGSITGLMGDAVLLGDGNGSFQQNMGASVTGNVNLEGGDDTFILAWNASSVDGIIDGGAGTDTAILGGTLDADNLVGFESTSLGTQSDLRISGNRTLQGDVTIDGNVILGLGVDTLTTTGALLLQDTATITIETPLDVALVGQTVLVLQDGAGFTDNGATINIIDDDLLVDYIPVVGSLSVQVVGVNQLLTAGDSNLVTFGTAVTSALNAGTLSQASFDLINNLPDVNAFSALAVDALPTLNNGAPREIFETSSAASDALNRHLMGDASGVWGQFIVRGADQDGSLPTAGGYDSDQTIFTVGGDFAYGELGRVGLLASYANIENDDLDGASGGGQTDIDSFKVGIYAGANFADRGFVNGEISYLTGEIESARSGAAGPISSSYDFDGFAYRMVAGYDLLPDANVALTPSIGFNGATMNFDDAVETGGFGLTVDREGADFFELRGSVELSGQVSPMVDGFIQGTVVHNLSDSPRVFNLSSVELGQFAIVSPEIEQNRFELAAGVNVKVSENFGLQAGYLGDYAEGYTAHSARITARYAF